MPRAPHQRGFSLIELLVVLTIIGILVGLATLSVGLVGDDRTLEEEARRTQTLLRFAAEEGLLQGRDFGVLVEPHGYQFLNFDYERGAWVAYSGDDLFRPRTLPEGHYFELTVEGQEVLLEESAPATEEGQELVPQIALLSSGELLPFTLRIARDLDDKAFILEGQPTGAIEIRRDADDE